MDSTYSQPINTSVMETSASTSSVGSIANGVSVSASSNEAVRSTSLEASASGTNTTSHPHDGEFRDYHANAHTQAIVYIVIILVLYFSALTVIVVRYMRKERSQFHLPSYLMRKDRSPPSPSASSFRINSGRRQAQITAENTSITADFIEVTHCLNTVSNQMMMDTQQQDQTPQDQSSALLVDKVQIDTTTV